MVAKKICLLVLPFLIIFFSPLENIVAAAPEKDIETDACSASLFGTVSKEYCQAICPEGTEYGCLKVKDFPGKNPADSSKDLECYTCARDQYCSDLGYMDVWDCWLCDANPATECVKAGMTVPLTGTTVGGKTWSGEQCYDCVARPDRCNQKWPGTTWLADCQKICAGPDKKCVFVGRHDGNDCYKCEEKIAECKDMGLLKEAECAACNADPKTQCVPWAMTKNMEKCFKCIPKNQPIPPQPPPPGQPEKSCASLGYAISAAVCRGQGMDWHLVDVPEIGEKCIECIKKKEDCSPNLTREGCQKYCEDIGGKCMAMTRTKEGPECYTCYWGEQQKQGCAYYDMPESCDPNPCFENEICVMVDRPLRLRCAQCQENENWKEPTVCEEQKMFLNCSYCYNAQMSCEKVDLKDPPLECFKCVEPPPLTPPTGGGESIGEVPSTGPTETSTKTPITGLTETSAVTVPSGPNVALVNNYPGITEGFSSDGQCPAESNSAGGSYIQDSVNWSQIFNWTIRTDITYEVNPEPKTDPWITSYQRLRRWLAEAKEDKIAIEKNIAELRSALTKPEVQNNPIIQETMKKALEDALDDLEDVDDDIYDLLDEVGEPEEMDEFMREHGFPRLKIGGYIQMESPAEMPRQWAEVKISIGRLDFGRMQSNWGMGIFNDTYLSDQGMGEMLGVSGPIVASGFLGKNPALAFFDSQGVPIGAVTRQDAMVAPQITNYYLSQAQDRSLEDFAYFMAGLDTPSFKEFEKLFGGNSSRDSYSLNGFQPQQIFVPQLGLSRGDISNYANIFNYQLINRAPSERFFEPQLCCGPSFIDEPVYSRHILAKKEVIPTDPNDPFYFKTAGKKIGKSGGVVKSFTKVLLGSGMKMGDGTMGGGDASISLRQDSRTNIVDQWGIRAVGYLPKTDPNSAWNIIDGSQKNVSVAVIDSGLDLNHPDAPQYIWTNAKEIPDNKVDDDKNGYVDDVHGWNFYEDNNDLRDFKGHGTIVTGIIAAKTNNGIGIAGINLGAEIMVLKVTDKNGNTDNLAIYRAVRYAVAHGAKVLNISLGDKGISKLEQLGINYANTKGVLVFVASGNDGGHISEYGPASARGAITVGAMNYDGTWSTVSNFGPNIALLAPGEQIYSLQSKDADWDGSAGVKDRNYTKASGTSFSTPMAAATASLIWAKNPQLTNVQVADLILSSAKDTREKGWDSLSGLGTLDASAALRIDPKESFYVQIVDLRVNRLDKKVKSVDVFGTVSGNLNDFVVELGRGKSPSKWTQVGGPFTQPAHSNWLCRIPSEKLKGSTEWTVRLKAQDKNGQFKEAQASIPFTTQKKVYDWEKEKH